MRDAARRHGGDEELWGRAGLLHDFDYEQHPDEHPLWGIALLQQMGESQEVIDAIAAHYPEKTGVQPEAAMQRWLFACDEFSGLITATAYVRPSKSIHEVEVKSVMKKLKTPAFAAGVKREDVARGAELVGLSVEDLASQLIAAMQAEADTLGLVGTA